MYQTGEKPTVRIAEFSAQWEGRTIEGAFPLRQFLGAGESSAVFLTTHDARNAAIKLIPADPQSAEQQLFRWREAAKLSHPNLIRIFSTGRTEVDGMALLYIVTDRAEEDLSEVLPDRSLTAVEAREMLEPTLGALEYIHRQGFVHGHLKPSNIMAVEDRLKISSDGIVRAGANEKSPASLYDPPERATGVVSPAGDVWSLGITLVEVLTQRLQSNGIVPASLPEPYGEIARGCLHSNPVDRLTAARISKILAGPEKPAVPRKRRYAPVGVIVLLVMVVIIVAGVIFMHTDTNTQVTATAPEVANTPLPQASPPAPAPKQEPRQIAKAAKAPEPEAKRNPEPKQTAAVPETASVVPVSGIIEQPLPEIMDRARNSIHGRVRFAVRVEVSPSGTVTDAKVESSGTSKYFSERALAAVRQWKFEPVSVNGSEVGQRWRVRFEFLKTGTKAQPQRISP
jgi:TonB family protein